MAANPFKDKAGRKLPSGQPKRGHLRSTDANPTQRTGRPDGTDAGQLISGHKFVGKSANPTQKIRPIELDRRLVFTEPVGTIENPNRAKGRIRDAGPPK